MSLWSCATCSKSFTRKGDLTRHELLHTGIKPHVCETCGKGFAQLSGLRTHRNVHSKAKPYACGLGTCKKAFGDPSSRARHRKETHSREGVYKCMIGDCGTRIKRRSAFVAHLRKHGLDPTSVDIDAIVFQSGEKGNSTSIQFATPGVENRNHPNVQSQSVSPSFLSLSDNSGSYPSTDSGGASYFMDKWPGDYPLDSRRVNLPPANNASLPVFDETANFCPDIQHDVYPYHSSNLENSIYSDTIFPSIIDDSHLSSSLNLPVLEPFTEAGIMGSQSEWSTPSSTYSTLYNTDFNDDVMSLSTSLGNDGFQESLSLLYNIV